MNEAEASQLLHQTDEADHAGRRDRLLQLADLLPDTGLLGFSGRAAEWSFEDVTPPGSMVVS